MALSNMEVFNKYYMPAIVERYAQMVQKFNEASLNTVVLSGELQEGDFVRSSFYKILSAQRRVDRYADNTSAASSNLEQSKEVAVKIAGGFGPIVFEPGQMTWLTKVTAEAVEMISTMAAESLLADQLNTVVLGGVAAIGNVAGATYDVTGTSGLLTQPNLNNTHALFGDRSQSLVGMLMTGGAYHSLVGEALSNQARLFTAGNVTVVDILGKRSIISDIPALETAGTPGTYQVLSLTENALRVTGGDDINFNIETSNGKQRIETTWQSDYTFVAGVKGFAWDEVNGGKSPIDSEIATGSNWDQVATSVKDIAGVLTIANRS